MKNFSPDYRDGGPMSNRATDSQLKRLIELKIKFENGITWLEAKKLLKDYHQNKDRK
jgi:hypothetical protein